MIVTNFGENLLTGRPPKTQSQLDAEKVDALAYLERRDATDLAEMLGLA